VVFFLTQDGETVDPILDEMRSRAGQKPAAKLTVRERELASDDYHVHVGSFAGTLKRRRGALECGERNA